MKAGDIVQFKTFSPSYRKINNLSSYNDIWVPVLFIKYSDVQGMCYVLFEGSAVHVIKSFLRELE